MSKTNDGNEWRDIIKDWNTTYCANMFTRVIEKEIKKAELRGKIEVLHKMIKLLENACPLENPTAIESGHLSASKRLLCETRDLEEELKKLQNKANLTK